MDVKDVNLTFWTGPKPEQIITSVPSSIFHQFLFILHQLSNTICVANIGPHKSLPILVLFLVFCIIVVSYFYLFIFFLLSFYQDSSELNVNCIFWTILDQPSGR